MRSALRWSPELATLLPDDVDPAAVRFSYGRGGVERGIGAAVRIGPGSFATPDLPIRYRFLALPPCSTRPRFLLPRDNQAAIRGMMRPRADIVRGARRTVLRLPMSLPGLMRAAGLPVELRTRTVAPTLARIEEVVPGADLGCMFGNSSNTGRFALCAYAKERLAVIAKVITAADACPQLDHEAAILRELHEFGQMRGSVPTLLGRLSVRAGEVLFTDGFMGTPCPTFVSPALHEWLRRCGHGNYRPAVESVLIRQVVARAHNRGWRPLAEGAKEVMSGFHSRSCIVHGDFVPWNIVIENGHARVFDWEYGVVDGVPAWDALYFRLQVGLITLSWTHRQLADEVLVCAARQDDGYTVAQYLGMAVLLLLDLCGRYADRNDVPRERAVALAVVRLADGDLRLGRAATCLGVGP